MVQGFGAQFIQEFLLRAPLKVLDWAPKELGCVLLGGTPLGALGYFPSLRRPQNKRRTGPSPVNPNPKLA